MAITIPFIFTLIGIALQAVGLLLMVEATMYNRISKMFRSPDVNVDSKSGKSKPVRIEAGKPRQYMMGFASTVAGFGLQIGSLIAGEI